MSQIDNLVDSHCGFCDYEKSKPCLSCMKYIIYLAIKDAYSDNLGSAPIDFEEAISEGVSKSFGYLDSREMKDAVISGVSLSHGHVR